jgi:hypothetical protein
MRSGGFSAAILVGCLTVACGTQPPPTVRQQSSAAPANPAPLMTDTPLAEPPHVAFRTATGRLAAYDMPTRLLTVEAATGSSRYRVAADARVWLGRRRLPVSDLAAYLGEQVTIAFAETNGVRTTHTVRVAEGERAGRSR